MKPKINIEFANGRLGQVTPLESGVFGFVIAGAEVSTKLEFEKAYQLKSLKDLTALGISNSITDANKLAYKTLSEFYAESGEGTEVWLLVVEDPAKASEMVDGGAGDSPVKIMLDSAQGKIRGVFLVPNYTATTSESVAMDADVLAAATLAQQLFEDYTANNYAPFFTVLDAYGFVADKVNLPDLTASDFNAVAVMVGNTEIGLPGASLGVLAGRLAKYEAKVNPGKVRNGALRPLKMFIGSTAVENFDTEALLDKGFITFTTHAGRSGYYVLDCPQACAVEDDYHYVTHRRTINEAFRLTYTGLLDFHLDEVPVNNDGTIMAVYAKTMESAVVRKISTTMGDQLSKDETDPKDFGVKCFVDPAQNVVATSRVEVNVAVRPFGYNRWIDVQLGFDINS